MTRYRLALDAYTLHVKPDSDSWSYGEMDTIDADGAVVGATFDQWTTYTTRWNPDGTVSYTITNRAGQVLYTRTWWPAGSFPHMRKPSIRRRARHARSRR